MRQHVDEPGRDGIAMHIDFGAPMAVHVPAHSGDMIAIDSDLALVRRLTGSVVDEPIAQYGVMLGFGSKSGRCKGADDRQGQKASFHREAPRTWAHDGADRGIWEIEVARGVLWATGRPGMQNAQQIHGLHSDESAAWAIQLGNQEK